ncbi:MAG: outer membrane lipoprotein carrier protein LolA [Candidatus Cloacimonetes bacterium]|nr:outer membrane lipoprotein carrier protein LolA [Candidatus Cloacimonadota bacterium]
MKKINLLLLLTLICCTAYSTTASDNLFLKTKEKYANIVTLEADFTQGNYYAIYDAANTSFGKIYIENDSFVMEYNEPEYYFFKLEGDQLTVYSEEHNTASVYVKTDEYDGLFSNFLEVLSMEYSFIERERNYFIYSITHSNEEIVDFKIHINWRTEQLEKVIYEDNMDNQVVIIIENQVFDKPLSKQIKEFTIPKGTPTLTE